MESAQRPPKRVGALRVYMRENAVDAATFFGDDITRKLREFHAEGRDVLFLSSGGSSIGVLDRIDPDVIAPYLTIGIFDERWDPTNKASNYAALRKTWFYRRAVERGCRLIDTATGEKQTMDALGDTYEHELRNWRQRHPGGIMLATMGIAVDGHTAGIMPFPEDPSRFQELFEGERWIVAYDAKGKNPFSYRVTTTFTFLRQVDMIGVYLVGAAKGPVFRKIIEAGTLAECPGRVIKELPRGAIYVDRSMLRAAGFTL